MTGSASVAPLFLGNEYFADFVEDIFRKTYKIKSTALYSPRNYELRDKIKEAVIALRKSYDNDVCVTAYDEEEQRKAYMFAYYPYFCEAAYKIISYILNENSSLLNKIKRTKKLCCEYFACGPCPELFGTARALEKFCNKKSIDNVTLYVGAYDFEGAWYDPYFQITKEICREKTNLSVKSFFLHHFDIAKSSNILKSIKGTSITKPAWLVKMKSLIENADIIFMQNYLSHISDDDVSVNNFLNWFKNLAALAKEKTYFVIVDLKYGATRRVFNEITTQNFLNDSSLDFLNKISCVPNYDQPMLQKYPDTSFGIRSNIFDEKVNGLKAKNSVKYYKLVLQKEPPLPF